MSPVESRDLPCLEVLSSLVFIVEGALSESPHAAAIESHLYACPNCQAEISHERTMHDLLQIVLRRSCDEKAPEDLHEQLHQQLLAQMNAHQVNFTEIVTQFSMTEISIEIDEFGQVEHREIQIQSTHEYRITEDEE